MTLSEIGPVVLVGAGKMGLAMARGWLSGGLPASQLVLVDPQPAEVTRQFAEEFGVRLLPSAIGVLTHVLVLAVKPQVMHAVLSEIAPVVGRHTLVLSVAAGISLATLSSGLGVDRIVRTMPNTPAQIGKGITGAVGLDISDEDRLLVDSLLKSTGQIVWFSDEKALDAVTAVSGSGPAYVFHLVEALAAAGEQEGLEAEEALRLARQTIIGAAALLEAQPDQSAGALREAVTSPKGTTAAALAVLMAPDGLPALMARAVHAARVRSQELGRS
ncbi:pyrroline-5-carboxylate reductase [Devosia enhydra]|uniref:Pyrroline-5-carboxylate reductase n=1 Tax=Devosia enhydra TaxID=665118 RepID=A0A1K2HTE9_9HYPH|nr:pyrroline-5-carboxylate reductase [Devosia enhydra]SFZ81375.1 pyrroline-5-carboxylate reductase [Devosia enhydra]